MHGGYVSRKEIDEFKEYTLSYVKEKIKGNYEPFQGNLNNAYDIKDCLFSYKIPNIVKNGSIKLKYFRGKRIDKNIAIILGDHIAISSTYHSMDGEYRTNLIPINYYKETIKIHKKELDNILDKILLMGKTSLDNYNTDIDPYYVLTAYYIINFYRGTNGFPTHNAIPYEIIYKKSDTDIFDIKSMLVLYGLFIIKYDSNLTPHENLAFKKPTIGIKILPSYVNEITSIGDIKYNIWLELYICSLVNSLILNGRTPFLAFTFNFSMTKVSDYKKIFDLGISHLKYEHSKNSEIIEKLLEKAKSKTYIEETEIYINYRFKRMRDEISKTMKLGKDILTVSDHALIIYNIYKGPSLKTSMEYMKETISAKNNPFLSDGFLLRIIYSLYCLNRIGVIHSDLHLNNIVVKYNFTYKALKELFIVEDNYYYSDRGMMEPIIIDFSRSVISEELIDKYTQDPAEKSLIMSKQREKIRDTIKYLLPEYYEKNEKDIYQNLLSDYKGMFNRFAALDAYRFTKSLMGEYSSDIGEGVHFNYKKLQEVNFEAEKLFRAKSGKNPNALMMKMFKSSNNDKVISDIYTEYDLIYNINSYEELPPLCKVIIPKGDEIIKQYKTFPNKYLDYENEWSKMDTTIENPFNFELI